MRIVRNLPQCLQIAGVLGSVDRRRQFAVGLLVSGVFPIPVLSRCHSRITSEL